MEILVAADTNIGKERDNNEDSLLCAPERGLFVVCDGMGGMAAGDEASRAAITTLGDWLCPEDLAKADTEAAIEALLTGAFLAANAAIVRKSKEQFGWRGMGSTVVAAVLEGERIYVGNLGDSRGYLFRANGECYLLTEDHSTAAELVRNGAFTPEEARHHTLRNRLTAALGHLEEGTVPGFNSVTLVGGDNVLLCSDGLWDLVEEDEIADIVRSAETTAVAVEWLIAAANTAGGHDNITAIVLRVPGESVATPVPPTQERIDPYKPVRRSSVTVRRYPEQD